MWRWIGMIVCWIGLLGSGINAQTDAKPMIFPVAIAPGPQTWLFGQAYGNTTGAFNFGTAWYSAGQGLHFGIDVGMPCGTPLVATADGVIWQVDNLAYGAGPHNLLIRHEDLGLVSLYGHLQPPIVMSVGQRVAQGALIGYSGDPDITCFSRPHLHYEVRSLDAFTTYNPVDYIDIPWHSLTIVGSYSYPLFQGDMDNARRWMTLEDQPPVRFGGTRLNAYNAVYPPPNALRPPPNPTLLATPAPLPENPTGTLTALGDALCCWQFWFDPIDPDRFYVIDGEIGTRAQVYAWSVAQAQVIGVHEPAPPTLKSADHTYQIALEGDQAVIRGPEAIYTVNTAGSIPSLSADHTQLLWITNSFSIPGGNRPPSSVWISALDGSNARAIADGRGIGARWLDATRLLISESDELRQTTLTVYETVDGSSFTLGTWAWMRAVDVGPGGERLLFYTTYQPDSGLMTIETQPGSQAQPIAWFGGWRWRDANSVYYIPQDISTPLHRLHLYDFLTGEDRVLIDSDEIEFTVMNGDWDVSSDGTRLLFQNGRTFQLSLLTLSGD